MTAFDIVFEIRGYELDAEGKVPAYGFLRYMEHLRWEHTIRDLPEITALFRKGNAFVVVAQTLRVTRDTGRSSPIRGSLWIVRAGRTSIVFHHAFHRVDDGELFAAGSTTAVYLSPGGMPAPLPDCLVQTDPDPEWMPDLNAPKFGEISPAQFEYSYRVRAGDLDFLGHMNQASYAAIFDDTRQAAANCNAYGTAGMGIGRIRLLHVEYLHPAMMGEKLAVATWTTPNNPPDLMFAMRRNDTLISRAVIRI